MFGLLPLRRRTFGLLPFRRRTFGLLILWLLLWAVLVLMPIGNAHGAPPWLPLLPPLFSPSLPPHLLLGQFHLLPWRGLVRRFMPNLANGKAPLLPFEAGEAGFLIHLRRWYGLRVYSEAITPIVPEDNTDLSGFYSRPPDALSATGVAGAQQTEDYPADLNPPYTGGARPVVHRPLGTRRWHYLDLNQQAPGYREHPALHVECIYWMCHSGAPGK
ncbi:UNVERIFIED_CONTAM: hypothetical protein FKN15_036952 [Acipenser sinensis]